MFESLTVFWHLRADMSNAQPLMHVLGWQTPFEQVAPTPFAHDVGHLLPRLPQFDICRERASAQGRSRCAGQVRERDARPRSCRSS